jgi:hypothetical protein
MTNGQNVLTPVIKNYLLTDNLGLRPWDHNQDDYSPLAPEIAFALALTALVLAQTRAVSE